jgi:hypothetical protein
MRNYVLGGPSSGTKLFQGERWLVMTGILGILLAGICAVWVLLYGGPISPDGDVSKAVSFNAALGIFLISTAAISPLSALGKRSKMFFRWSYIVLALYSYGAETIQNFRGVNPRFVKDGTAWDVGVGSGFALVAMLLVLYYLFLAIQYFRRKTYKLRPELVVGIRYAMIAVMLSFAAGIWISVNQSRITGFSGNIIWLHGLGFHALQVMPLVAWLAGRSSLTSTVRNRLIHLTGIAYLLGLASIGCQTLLGHSILEWSVLPLLACGFFLLTSAMGAIMLRHVMTSTKGNPNVEMR